MNKPVFKGTSISSLESLAAMFGITKTRLEWIISSVPKSYNSFTIITGRNKKERRICEPKPSLKSIQRKINSELFERVEYPNYLHGGLSAKDYISNASQHTKKRH
ncbi:hypothetical protein [Dickeya oryzae]|uniref:hypothetical protein n=1 Tax=Dickeya oryzae TaxID=1240404 RepID=UPI001E65D89D|nr:hypothetical protein [Dickeya oryzae]